MVKALSNPSSYYHTSQSARAFAEAEQFIPGGVTANIKYFDPYPIFMKKGDGSKLIDLDDNEYIDYSLCYGSLITGHGNQRVQEATVKQLLDSGTVIFGTPHELEIQMAKRIHTYYPSMEKIRFANSGTEANLLALRLATAYTGKQKIAKFEGHYHGGLNELLYSINPDAEHAGNLDTPRAVAESSGMAEQLNDQTIILPFNRLEATERLLRQHQDELAAIFIEPVQGGFIEADQSFMDGLRDLTRELNILLVFDEVKTGFRIGLGGAQEHYQIKPDLTTLGKAIGGGYPIGVIGGRSDVMMLSAANGDGDVFAVGSNSRATTSVAFHSGTYNGHPLVLAAGLETLKILEEEDMINSLNKKTRLLRDELERLYEHYQIPMKTFGLGSIFNIVLCNKKVSHYRDMWEVNIDLRKKIDHALFAEGVYIKPLNRYSLSTAHTSQDIKQTVLAHEKAIQHLKREGIAFHS